MELTKIRNLSDEELSHQEKTSAEQLFRLRFQVAMGQNDGVKKLRELRKEIAQMKTIARERELGIHLEIKERKADAPAVETKVEKAPAAAQTRPAKTEKAKPAAKAKEGAAKKAAPAADKKTAKAKEKRK
jgi:large subunit ribosomal protein L29